PVSTTPEGLALGSAGIRLLAPTGLPSTRSRRGPEIRSGLLRTRRDAARVVWRGRTAISAFMDSAHGSQYSRYPRRPRGGTEMNGERQRTPRGWARLVKPTGLSPVPLSGMRRRSSGATPGLDYGGFNVDAFHPGQPR